MISFVELKRLVAMGEGPFLEFKKKADHPEKIVRELVAFANSNGGKLLLGVDDNGGIPGLKYPDEEAFVMEAAINLYSKPTIPFELKRVKIPGGVEVLVYQISGQNEKPFYWLADKKNQQFRIYVRSKDQSIQASKEMVRLLRSKTDTYASEVFQLNPLEKKMLAYFTETEYLTLRELSRIGKIPPWKASLKLVAWVKKGILRIEPSEGQDFYFLQEKYQSFT